MRLLSAVLLSFVLFVGTLLAVPAFADGPKDPVTITNVILTGTNTAIFTIQDADGVDYTVIVIRGKDAQDIAKGSDGQTVFVYEAQKLIIALDLSVEI